MPPRVFPFILMKRIHDYSQIVYKRSPCRNPAGEKKHKNNNGDLAHSCRFRGAPATLSAIASAPMG